MRERFEREISKEQARRAAKVRRSVNAAMISDYGMLRDKRVMEHLVLAKHLQPDQVAVAIRAHELVRREIRGWVGRAGYVEDDLCRLLRALYSFIAGSLGADYEDGQWNKPRAGRRRRKVTPAPAPEPLGTVVPTPAPVLDPLPPALLARSGNGLHAGQDGR